MALPKFQMLCLNFNLGLSFALYLQCVQRLANVPSPIFLSNEMPWKVIPKAKELILVQRNCIGG